MHLLVETGAVQLSKIMQGLQQSYTLYFNRKYGLVGHLFQGRYKAIVCDRDPYLLELVRYIHLNPVRCKMGSDPAAYPWSSHRAYLGKAGEQESDIGTDWVLSQFSTNRLEAVKKYRRFVLEGIGEGHRDDLYETKEQRYLGDEEFVERVSRKFDEKLPEVIQIDLREIEEAVCQDFALAPALLHAKSKERRGAFGRAVVGYVGQELAGTRICDMAKRFGRDQVSLSLGLKHLRERIGQDSALRKSLESLIARLKKGRKSQFKLSNV